MSAVSDPHPLEHTLLAVLAWWQSAGAPTEAPAPPSRLAALPAAMHVLSAAPTLAALHQHLAQQVGTVVGAPLALVLGAGGVVLGQWSPGAVMSSPLPTEVHDALLVLWHRAQANPSLVCQLSDTMSLLCDAADGALAVAVLVPGAPDHDQTAVLRALAAHGRAVRHTHTIAAALEARFHERTQGLERAADYANAVLNTSSDALFTLRWPGGIQQMNRAFHVLFHTQGNPDAYFRRDPATLFSPESVHALRQGLDRATQQRAPQRLELVAQRHDGARFDADVFISPLLELGDATAERLVVSVRDVSRMKEELRRERQVSALKSYLMRMASHEFRTPLTIIHSSLQLLQQYAEITDHSRVQRQLRTIDRALGDMIELLEDIVLYDQLEASTLALRLQTLSMAVVCQDVITRVQLAAPGRVVMLHDASAGRLLVGDEQLLRRVVINLASNALKYSPSSKPVDIHIGTDDATGHTLLTVQDQGIGIPLQDQARIFDDFQRASNVGATSGTGIGLAIVKRAVQLHGGRVWFQTTLNQGTTFYVTLPPHPPATQDGLLD